MGGEAKKALTMSARNYECMFLLDSSRFAQDPAGVEQEVKDTLERVGATLVSSAPFQDGKLAYEIAGRRKGLHYLTYFKAASSVIDELNRVVRINELVLRHLVIEHPDVLFDAMSGALAQHSDGSPEDGAAAPAAAT